MHSPFFEETFDNCIFMLTEKWFEVTVCYEGDNVVIFIEKGGINNKTMEQLFVKDEISDEWMLIPTTWSPWSASPAPPFRVMLPMKKSPGAQHSLPVCLRQDFCRPSPPRINFPGGWWGNSSRWNQKRKKWTFRGQICGYPLL